MKLPRRQFLHLAAGAAALPAVSRIAQGASLSDAAGALHRRLSPPAARIDIVARLIGQWLSERLGQPFIIENRPGAGSNIATEAVVRAPADGYTLLLVPASNAINATLYDKLNFNFIRDIAPVAGIIRVPIVMVVNPSVPAKTVPEFIAYAKANPGKINMASAGIGSASTCRGRAVQDDGRRQHGPRALSRRRARADRSDRRTGAGDVRPHARVDRVHQGRQAARAGGDHRDALGGAAGHADRGRFRAGLRGERVAGRRRAQDTPAEIIDKLNQEINAGLADPKIKARLADLGGTPMPVARRFGKLIADETEKWAKVIRAANIKAE